MSADGRRPHLLAPVFLDCGRIAKGYLEIPTETYWDISCAERRISGEERHPEWRPQGQSVSSQQLDCMSFSGSFVFRKHAYIEPRSRRYQHHQEHYGRLLRFQKGDERQVDAIKTVSFDRAWRFSQRSRFIVSRSQS